MIVIARRIGRGRAAAFVEGVIGDQAQTGQRAGRAHANGDAGRGGVCARIIKRLGGERVVARGDLRPADTPAIGTVAVGSDQAGALIELDFADRSVDITGISCQRHGRGSGKARVVRRTR